MQAEDVKRVGVVGCGLMGSGIVQVLAQAGAEVTFVEGSPELVERGRASVQGSVRKAVDRGKLTSEDADALLGRVSGATALGALDASDLVVEAATEQLDAKREISAPWARSRATRSCWPPTRRRSPS